MTTTIKAAARWNGDGFDAEDIPHFIAVALGSSKLAFTPPTMTVTKADDSQVTGNTGDWLMQLEDDSFDVATNDDFTANYEIAA